VTEREEKERMKLSEYIFDQITPYLWERYSSSALTVDDIEKWIVEWYVSEFKEIGCDKGDTQRMPPSWLANWRKR